MTNASTQPTATPSRHLLRPPPEAAVLGLRAMKMVASEGGAIRPGARRLLLAAQRIFLGVDVALDDLSSIEPEALAAGLPAALREQFVRAMVVMSFTDGVPSPGSVATIDRFARALGVDQPAIETTRKFAEGHLWLGRLDYLRRSNIRGMVEGELEHGVLRAAKSLLGIRGLLEDPALAARYAGFASLPEGTLGKVLFAHYRKNGFTFPGEKGGFPESGIYHDMTHVLSGYDTDPQGELQVGAFTAGYRKKDPLYVAMLPLLLFCADINVTPIPHDHTEALFSQPGIAEEFIVAYERGADVRLDLSDHWDFWPEVARPIADVRRDLGIV
jgi:hypothetical protein